MKKTRYLLLAVLLGLGLTACDEAEFLSENNPNELSTSTYYKTDAQAQAAVNAVYAAMQTNDLFTRRYYFVFDLLSNHGVGTTALQEPMLKLQQHNFDSSNEVVRDIWRGMYRVIHRANLVIDNVPSTPDPTAASKLKRYEAEARFMRAWAYYELTAYFGPVPLYTKTVGADFIATGSKRASIDEVYQLIMDDLAFAEANLPNKSGYGSGDTGRAPKAAAIYLKGKAHLQRNQWQQAAAEFQKVINSGEYRLMNNYFDNFTEESENNDESLFEIQYQVLGNPGWLPDGRDVTEMTYRAFEYGMTAWRNVVISPDLMAAYEPNDPRKKDTVYEPCDKYGPGNNTTLYAPNSACPPVEGQPAAPDNRPNWKKYQNYYKFVSEPWVSSGINHRVYRYAEVLLDMAEAQAELGNTAMALQYLNQVRARPSVNLPPVTASSKQALIDAIYKEKYIELAGEQQFYKDLVRREDQYRRFIKNEPGVRNVVLPRDLLLPIPLSELDANAALSQADQNPGF